MLIKLNIICMLMSAQRLASHNGGKGGMEVRARDTSHYRYSVAMAAEPQRQRTHRDGGHTDGGVT